MLMLMHQPSAEKQGSLAHNTSPDRCRAVRSAHRALGLEVLDPIAQGSEACAHGFQILQRALQLRLHAALPRAGLGSSLPRTLSLLLDGKQVCLGDPANMLFSARGLRVAQRCGQGLQHLPASGLGGSSGWGVVAWLS